MKVRLFKIIVLLVICYCIISKPKLSEDLKQKLSKIRKVDNVNFGGCGYVAYYISKYLEPRKITHQIVRIKCFGIGHFMVKANDIYIDVNGFWSKYFPIILFGKEIPFTQENLRVRLNDKELWNSSFNRGDSLVISSCLTQNFQ